MIEDRFRAIIARQGIKSTEAATRHKCAEALIVLAGKPQSIRLVLGELTAAELRAARAALQYGAGLIELLVDEDEDEEE